MRTPAGKDCRFFFGDYFRGRHHEECRLLGDLNPPLPWKPALCQTCPVPGILYNNACQNLVLRPRLARPFPFIQQRVQVMAFCLKSKEQGFDPNVGCGTCHQIPVEFQVGPDEPDVTA